MQEFLRKFAHQGIVEYQAQILPDSDPVHPDARFVHCINPLALVPKEGSKGRPVIDLTRGGVNQYLLPWGQALPTVKEVLA